MTAYYNEFDPKIAAWLRQPIKNGDIAPGEVDERSITDVTASDLRGFTQHHFFAGVGTWSYALRNAGWADNRSVCTASLPCQPFSVAGKQAGKDDERHLLPHFIELVRQCQFDIIFGEQVGAAIRHGWLDDLQANMEAENYAIGHAVLGAHSVNAPHQRQRLYWVAHASGERLQGHGEFEQVDDSEGWQKPMRLSSESGINSGMGDTQNQYRWPESQRTLSAERDARHQSGRSGEDSGLGDPEHNGRLTCEKSGSNEASILNSEKGANCTCEPERASSPGIVSSVDYNDVDWLYCRDNKYRPIKSGLKPLVDGLARGVVYSGGAINANNTGLERSMRIKGYGNAIHAETAQVFIESVMEVIK